jgi:hypothetical protein
VANLVITGRLRPAQLKTVERRLAGRQRAVRAPRLQLAGQHRHRRIATQFVVIVDVLVAQRNPEHPLAHQGFNAVLDQFLAATIVEATGKPIDQSNRPLRHRRACDNLSEHRPSVASVLLPP